MITYRFAIALSTFVFACSSDIVLETGGAGGAGAQGGQGGAGAGGVVGEGAHGAESARPSGWGSMSSSCSPPPEGSAEGVR